MVGQRRWTAIYVGILAVTFLAVLASPLLAQVVASRLGAGQQHGGLYGLLAMMVLRTLIPTIGMAAMLWAVLRRAAHNGHGRWLRIYAALMVFATIPFFANLVTINSLDRFVAFPLLLLLSTATTGLGFLIVACVRIGSPKPWQPRNDRVAKAVLIATSVLMMGAIVSGAVLALNAVLLPFSLQGVGVVAGDYLPALALGGSNEIRIGVQVMLVLATAWAFIFNDHPSTEGLFDGSEHR